MRGGFYIGILLQIMSYSVQTAAQTMLPDTLCEGTSFRTYFVNGLPNSTYSWTVQGGILLPPGNTDTVIIDWSVVQSGIYTITVVEQADNGCSGDPVSTTVFIIPFPAVTLPLCTPITSRDAKPFSLKGGIPLHGVYSGTGVINGIFDPSLVPPGQDTVIINYYYSTTNGCSGSASAVLTVISSTNHICGTPYTDPRDQKVYGTKQFGTRCWLTTNLNFGTQITGSAFQRDNCSPEKYCFEGLSGNCTNFGGLYQWDELMEYNESDTVQGLCPPGWHIPTELDWQELINLFQDAAHAGTDLKSSGNSGFNALIHGFYINSSLWKFGSADTTLNATMFWSSTRSGSGKSFAHGLNSVLAEPDFTTSISTYSSNRIHAYSVRCLRD